MNYAVDRVGRGCIWCMSLGLGILCFLSFIIAGPVIAQEQTQAAQPEQSPTQAQEAPAPGELIVRGVPETPASPGQVPVPAIGAVPEEEGIIPVMKFKDADIKIVLQAIAEKASRDGKKVNIVISPKVEGLVSVNLENVDWQTALEVVLKTYGYGSMRHKEVVIVAPMEEIKEREIQERERQGVEPPQLKIFKLKYLDANDAKKAITPLLSPVGKVSVLEVTGQAGWEFSTSTDAKSGALKRERRKSGAISRTKVLVVSDISRKLDEVASFLKELDVMPKQIVIRTKAMEVNRDLLRDIGVDWGTGTNGTSYGAIAGRTFSQQYLSGKGMDKNYGGSSLFDKITPAAFDPKAATLSTANTGLQLAFKQLTGADLEVILHALEEDVRTNILSVPTIITLNNQEASILVGEKYPIVATKVSEQTSKITGASLDYYQEIGVQLNVVPQICGENEDFINLIIHPVVSSSDSTLQVKTEDDIILVEYPIIEAREADTQLMIRDGETVVMGGLIKDVKTKGVMGIPFLKDLPLIGRAFRRDTYDTQKIDLVIFITAKILKPGEDIPESIVSTASARTPFRK